MKTHNLKKLVVVIALFFSGGELFAADAGEVLDRMSQVLFASQDQESTVIMTLTDRSGNQRRREARIWQKGKDRHLFRFTAPANEAGIALLSLPDDVLYLYMPAYGRERRIASHMKGQSFAGTDLSYEDLEIQRYSEEFSAVLAEQSESHYLLELSPKQGVRSDYSRVVVRVNADHYYPELMKTYDRRGQEYKVIEYTFELMDSYWYAREILVSNLKREHSTHMEVQDIIFDTGLTDETFSIRNLIRN